MPKSLIARTMLILLFAGEFGYAAGAEQPAATRPAVDGVQYHVGPGQKFTRVVDVPWETLNPGDGVFIHFRTSEQGGDYHEKINLTRAGTPETPIYLIGVKGPHGERPGLNGKDAVTRTVDPQGNSTFWPGNQERGVLCFSGRAGSDFKTGSGADHWEVSGLKITGARPANDFTDSFGKPHDYQRKQAGLGSAGAGVFIDRGNYLHFSDLELTDNNNGFFGSSDDYGSESRHVHDITLEHSLLYGNGAPNNASVHNAYVEAANFTVRGNWFGPLVKGSGGSHLKDRGANVVIEGNTFDDVAVPLFLDPPENSLGWMDKQPGFDKITVRNNVFYKADVRPSPGQDVIITGFGDVKAEALRTVELSHNTFVFASAQASNWNINFIDLMGPRPQVIRFDHNVLARFDQGRGKTPSQLSFIIKIYPVDARTIVDVGTGNWIGMGEPWIEQKPGNGSATMQGFDKVGKLPGTLAELEKLLAINLHDPATADFGRFDPAKNAWYRQQKAGATMTDPPTTRPALPAPAAKK